MSTSAAALPLAPAPPDADQGGVNLLRVVVWEGNADSPLSHACRVSFPQEVWLWPDIGMAWGSGLREAVTLALNVLHRWRPPHAECRTYDWHRPLCCSQLAYHASWGFWHEVIRPVPFWGGHLPARLIQRWLDRHLHNGRATKWGMDWATPRDLWPDDAQPTL